MIDLRYREDVHDRVNRRALDRLGRDGTGMTSLLNLLEACGILSVNLSAAALRVDGTSVANTHLVHTKLPAAWQRLTC